MKEYRQLTLPQRYEIAALKKAGHSQQAIAAQLGVSPSTISRELKRNRSSSGYYGQAAPLKGPSSPSAGSSADQVDGTLPDGLDCNF